MPRSASRRRSSSPKAVIACANLILLVLLPRAPPPAAGSGQHLQRKRPRWQGWLGCQQKSGTGQAPERRADPLARLQGGEPRMNDLTQAELAELAHEYPRWQITPVFGGFLAVEKPAAHIQAMNLERLRELLTEAERDPREAANPDAQPA